MLNNLIEEFRDKIDVNDYFSYINFEMVKEELLLSKNNIIFLLGEPGSGKSFMLNYLYNKYPDKFILQQEPFFSKEEFLSLHPDLGDKTILVDEAQLLDEKMIEFLRLLSDKSNRVVFSMHEKEGEQIAEMKHFKSRYTHKIYMKKLTYEDFENYVLSKFITHQKQGLIDRKILKKIFKLTKGNFRFSKKFIFTALSLLDYSLRNSLKYKKIDNCIFEMSAIELGLLR